MADDARFCMDSRLEQLGFWPDFHIRFLNYWCEAIADQLPPDYEARMDDVAVTRDPTVPPAGRGAGASLATIEPVTIPLLIEEAYREVFIEVRRRADRSLVAVLELLSPANKQLPGRSQYLVKRHTLLSQPVHLIELDLLILGQRLPLAGRYPPGDYFALVSRAERRPQCDVYAWRAGDRLPPLPTPLQSPDADIWINLAEVFATAYRRGRYAEAIARAAAR